MLYKMFSRIFICTAVLLVFNQTNYGCMYGEPLASVCEIYSESDFVVTGEIKKISVTETDSEKKQIAAVEVLQTFKGNLRGRIVVNKVVYSCLFSFDEAKSVGKKYILFLKRDAKTKELSVYEAESFEKSLDDQVWLNALPGSLKRTLIFGKIEHTDYNSRTFDFVKYMIGTKVKISDGKNSAEVLTDKNGIFKFWDLPVGKYKIAPEYPADYGLIFPLTYGPVEFRRIDENEFDTKDFAVEAAPGKCGGADYYVDLKENLQNRN